MSFLLYSLIAIPLLIVLMVRRRRDFVRKLRGPPSSSWLLGHELEMRTQAEVGDLDFAWVPKYGTTFCISACWGRKAIMTVDPRALQYILHTSGYHYPKRPDTDQAVRIIMGRGIMWASGDVHKRHRTVMNPAFTTQQLRGFLPIFQHTAARLTQAWKDQIQSGNQYINASRWLARATLDAIGEAAFDYQFGAIDDENNKLSKSFENLFADTVRRDPRWDILYKGLWRYIPAPILPYVGYLPTKASRRFRNFQKLAKGIAAQLVEQKTSAALAEKSSQDIMSVLVQANTSEDPKRRLDEDEVLSQMTTLMLAGHETTASTLAWLLYELCNHPEDQKKVREEIQDLRAKVPGVADFTMADLDSLTFTNAVIKETLRLHPIVPTLVRTADRDDMLPLSFPVTTKDGHVVSEIAVKKDQDVFISICAYNRLPSIWGEDAKEWHPRRFLDISKEKQTYVGVLSNLMTFSAGVRTCIGWRFALIELQALLVELIENFQFSMPEGVEIIRLPAALMIPMVKGKKNEGTQMPLIVSLVDK